MQKRVGGGRKFAGVIKDLAMGRLSWISWQTPSTVTWILIRRRQRDI